MFYTLDLHGAERRGSGFRKTIEDYQFQHTYTKELAPEFLSEHGAFFLIPAYS